MIVLFTEGIFLSENELTNIKSKDEYHYNSFNIHLADSHVLRNFGIRRVY